MLKKKTGMDCNVEKFTEGIEDGDKTKNKNRRKRKKQKRKKMKLKMKKT